MHPILGTLPGAEPINLGAGSAQAVMTAIDPLSGAASGIGQSAPALPGASTLADAVGPVTVFQPTATPGRGMSTDLGGGRER